MVTYLNSLLGNISYQRNFTVNGVLVTKELAREKSEKMERC